MTVLFVGGRHTVPWADEIICAYWQCQSGLGGVLFVSNFLLPAPALLGLGNPIFGLPSNFRFIDIEGALPNSK